MTGLSSGTSYIYSAVIKRLTGSGTISMTTDGSTWTDVTSQVNSSGFSWVELPAVTGATSYIVGFQLGTSGDAIAVDFNQLENVLGGVSHATTPIITTTTTSSRGVEMPAFGTTSTGFNDGQRIIDNFQFHTPLSCYAELTGYGVSGCVVKGGGNTASQRATGICNGTGATLNGVTTANTGAGVRGTIERYAFSVNGGRTAICLNGGTIATGSTGPDWTDSTDTHMALGNRGAGDLPINGYYRRFAMSKVQWSDATLKRITTAPA